MKIERQNFYILTGGPGSGKTTLLGALRQQGYACVDEVARKILQEQHQTGGNATHEGDQVKYRDLMFTRSVETYLQVAGESGPVFFDRGIPDLVGHCALIASGGQTELAEAVADYRYNSTVFIAPPWPEIYRQDEERKQDWEEAVQTYEALAEAYRNAGYCLIELPKASVADRVSFVAANIP